MTQRTLAITLIALILLLLIATTVGLRLLFDTGTRDFTGDVKGAIARAEAGDWAAAEQAAERAAQLWDQGNFLVALKYSETDYTLLNVFLARFRAAIAKQDVATARTDGAACLYLYRNITSIAPQP